MNNRVSFETAQKLKAAGFPKPEIKEGQWIYTAKNGYLAYIDCVEMDGTIYALMNGGLLECNNISAGIFRPVRNRHFEGVGHRV